MDNHTQLYDSHCRKPGCKCQHASCYRGWRDTPDTNHTTPCMDCRQETYERWLRAQEARTKGFPSEAISKLMTAAK